MSCSGMGESWGAGRRRVLASRRAQSSGGGQLPRAYRSCEMDRRRGVTDTLGRCTRVACAAVITLVLLGDNTSARVSGPPSSGVGAGRGQALTLALRRDSCTLPIIFVGLLCVEGRVHEMSIIYNV